MDTSELKSVPANDQIRVTVYDPSRNINKKQATRAIMSLLLKDDFYSKRGDVFKTLLRACVNPASCRLAVAENKTSRIGFTILYQGVRHTFILPEYMKNSEVQELLDSAVR